MPRTGRPKAELVLTDAEGEQLARWPSALEKGLRKWVAAWNENPEPFIWIKTAEDILASLGRLLQ